MLEKIKDHWNKYRLLILVVISMVVISLVIYFISFEAFLIVNLLFIMFFLIMAIIKNHYLYVGTVLVVSAQVIDEIYFYLYGVNSADIICMVLAIVGSLTILAVLMQGVIRIISKKNYKPNAIYVLFSVMVLGSMVLLSLTHSVSIGSINVFDSIGVYIVLNYIILILLTILTFKMIKFESMDVRLF